MPRKDPALVRVPFNCLISPVTKEAVNKLKKQNSKSQGEIVDRAVALLAREGVATAEECPGEDVEGIPV